MKKYVFGLGSAQVSSNSFKSFCSHLSRNLQLRSFSKLVESLAMTVGAVAHFLSKFADPAAIVIGNGLASSSTTVVLQVAFQNVCIILRGSLDLIGGFARAR